MSTSEHELRAALADWAQDRPELDDLRPRLDPRRRTGRLMIGAAAGVAAVVIGVSAAVGGLTGDDLADRPPVPAVAVPSVPSMGSCFGESDLETELRTDFTFGTSDPTADPNLARTVADAISSARDICAWHGVGGTFVSDPSTKGGGPIPAADPALALAVCVLGDGSLGVFAGPGTVCGELGLSVAVTGDPLASATD